MINVGDAFVAASFLNEILEVNGQGQVAKVIPVPQAQYDSLGGLVLDPLDNMLYAGVTTNISPSSVSGELVKIDPLTGAILGTISLPDDPAVYYDNQYYPFGFSIAKDGSFWIAQSNSDNIIHVDAARQLARYLLDRKPVSGQCDNQCGRECVLHRLRSSHRWKRALTCLTPQMVPTRYSPPNQTPSPPT